MLSDVMAFPCNTVSLFRIFMSDLRFYMVDLISCWLVSMFFFSAMLLIRLLSLEYSSRHNNNMAWPFSNYLSLIVMTSVTPLTGVGVFPRFFSLNYSSMTATPSLSSFKAWRNRSCSTPISLSLMLLYSVYVLTHWTLSRNDVYVFGVRVTERFNRFWRVLLSI